MITEKALRIGGGHCRSPRLLLLLGCLALLLAHAASDSPTPLPTADAQLLGTLFSADVHTELPQDDDARQVADFHWKRLLNLSHPAPFLLCATHGRKGYREMLQGFNQTDVLPLFANKTMSCQVIHSSATTLLNATASMTRVTIGTPVPSVLKISKELRERVNNGAFFDASRPSLRVILGPGMELRPGALANILRRFIRALRSGQYLQVVETDFEWSIVGSNSTAQRNRRLRIKRQRGRALMHQAPTNDDDERDDDNISPGGRTNGANYWAGHMEPVLDGNLKCNFTGVVASIQSPYLRFGGFSGLVTSHDEEVAHGERYSDSTCPAASACLMTLLAFISSDPAVLFLEEYPDLELHNAIAAYIIQSGNGPPGTLPFYDVGLDGTGQVVQVSDTGLDQESCFFRDPTGPVPTTTITTAAFDLNKRKVVQYVVFGDSIDEANGHGTHVVGTLLGVCNDPNFNMSSYQGVAPGAKVAFYDLMNSSLGDGLSVPSNLNTRLFPPAFAAGARLFSNSWGTRESVITYLDTEVDKWMYNNDEVLVTFSAGNGAALGLGTVFSPALSKNVLTVGASENERGNNGYNRNYVAYFSSLGPSSDGRVKPDVVAPGRILVSAAAQATCGTTVKQGTSMAAPVVAGSAAIVRQYFQDGWYPSGVKTAADGFRPTGALIKAALINSAVPMQAFKFLNGTLLPLGLPPDAYQGHGRIKLDEVLKVRDIETTVANVWVADNVSLAERQRHWYKFSFPADTERRNALFKITLVWIDPDTTASSNAIVLHNLDLLVQRQFDNKPMYPNGLLGPDDRNTVEKVVIYNPLPGDTLTVTVTGTSIATQPTQQYSLVASGNFVSGAWFCQHPKATRINTDFTTENCYAACDDYPKNPVCCGTTAGTVCSTQEAATAAADGLVCDLGTKPLECPTPAPTSPPTTTNLGQWYCQFPRSTRLNDAYTTLNCAADCDVYLKDPICCPLSAGSACSAEEYATGMENNVVCDLQTRPDECATPAPTVSPSGQPTRLPSQGPTNAPTKLPTQLPTRTPSLMPTRLPSREPSRTPSSTPTRLPTGQPTRLPSRQPTRSPSGQPTRSPSRQPSGQPSRLPTRAPSLSPSASPSLFPSASPSAFPNWGQWYCQFPRSSRLNDAYTIQNCATTCDGSAFFKNPICCPLSAGSACSADEYAAGLENNVVCDAQTKPTECVRPTPGPTRRPTNRPTLAPFLT